MVLDGTNFFELKKEKCSKIFFGNFKKLVVNSKKLVPYKRTLVSFI